MRMPVSDPVKAPANSTPAVPGLPGGGFQITRIGRRSLPQ
jgi:hypothetical protein